MAFEPATDIRVDAVLEAARSARGKTFQGYKGGDYTMDGGVTCWIAPYGTSGGQQIGSLLLELMLAAGDGSTEAPKAAEA